MMNFIEIAKKRCSVRSYSDKKVEKEKLDKILQAAHVAPTAANLQPVHLITVESKEGLEKISKGANIYNAPLAIIVCADHNKAWVRPFDKKQTGDIDASILTDHMMLDFFHVSSVIALVTLRMALNASVDGSLSQPRPPQRWQSLITGIPRFTDSSR